MSIGAGPQMSNFPYGFSLGALVRGIPINPTTPGQVFWVYNGTNLAPQGRAGSDGNGGGFESPKATIAGALLQCVAGRGDVIYVKPGHAETVSAAAGINLNVAGVSIIGLGSGNLRPSITFGTATTAQMTVTAAQMSLVNFILDGTGFDAIVSPISVSAADFQLLNCDCVTASASSQVTVFLTTTAAADRLIVSGNQFRGTTDAGTANVLQIIGGDCVQICNNKFIGAYTTSLGAINNITTAMTGALIQGNAIFNQTASSTKAMVLLSTSTGIICDNRMQILSGTAPITGAAMSWAGGNYYAATIATAGTLI